MNLETSSPKCFNKKISIFVKRLQFIYVKYVTHWKHMRNIAGYIAGCVVVNKRELAFDFFSLQFLRHPQNSAVHFLARNVSHNDFQFVSFSFWEIVPFQ